MRKLRYLPAAGQQIPKITHIEDWLCWWEFCGIAPNFDALAICIGEIDQWAFCGSTKF